MDYDDNDFGSQNRQLTGEGSVKFPSVLSPYALSKFDFDDSLQGHLRFDNLVETEVFLGIENQEDNHWIESFSQGNSGIEFVSSAAESHPISRPTNVWSEATSSESVEMLLKSVGQEEMIPGQTIMEQSGTGDQLCNPTNQIEPSLKEDDTTLSSVHDLLNLGPTLPINLDNLSKLEDSVLCAQEGEPSGPGYPIESNLDVFGEKSDIIVVGVNQLNDAKQSDMDSISNEALDNKTINESSPLKMQLSNPITDMQIMDAPIEKSNAEVVLHEEVYASDTNKSFIGNDLDKDGELHTPVKEVKQENQYFQGNALKSYTLSVDKFSSMASQVELVEEQNLIETRVDMESTSFKTVQENSEMEVIEACPDSPIIPVESSKCEVTDLTEDEHTNDHLNENVQERSLILLEGGYNSENKAGENNYSNSGIGAIVEIEIEPPVQIKDGQGSLFEGTDNADENGKEMNNGKNILFSEGQFEQSNDFVLGDTSNANDLSASDSLETHGNDKLKGVVNTMGVSEGKQHSEEIGKQMDSVVSASKIDVSLLFAEGNNPFEEKFDNSGDVSMGDTLSLKPFSSSDKLEAHGNEVFESVSKSSGSFGEGLIAKDHDSSSYMTKSEKCELDVVGDVKKDELGDASVENDHANFPTDPSEVVCEIVSSVVDNKDSSCSLVSGTVEDGLTVLKTQFCSSFGNEFASDDSLKNANFTSNDTLYAGSMPPVIAVTSLDIVDHKNDQMLQENFIQPDNKEVVSEILIEVSPLKLNDSEVVTVLGEVADSGNISCFNKAGEMNIDVLDLSEGVLKCKTTEYSDPKKTLSDKVREDHSNEQESCPVHCDLANRENFTADVATKRSEEENALEIAEDASLKVLDVDKPTCSSPTVIKSAENSSQEKEIQGVVKRSLDQSVTVPDSIIIESKKVSSVSHDVIDDLSKDHGSFSFDVSSLADLAKRETGNMWHQSTSMEIAKTTPLLESSPSVSGLGQVDTSKAHNISDGIAQATPEQKKTRRTSSKTQVKESGKKVQSKVVDKSFVGSLSPNLTNQLGQSEGMQHTGHDGQSSKKPANVLHTTTPNSILPDLNSSASLLAVFQQPFTDLQQVQLRAQIFVYGSLIQGTAPEEACMISAFGGFDGGRSIWGNAWCLSVERLRHQKLNTSTPGTPLQPPSGSRASDHANKQGSLQNKVTYSPVGLASTKAIPSPIVNSIIPPSSPLWSISTPSDALKSFGIPRSTVPDHNQVSLPLHPYFTPSVRSYTGQAWAAQPPYPGPSWVTAASPQGSPFNSNLRFSSLPITEPVKLTPIRESSGSGPYALSVSHMSHTSPIISSVGPTGVFPDATKPILSTGQDSVNPKSRKRKKAPGFEDPGHVSLSTPIIVPLSGITTHFSTPIVSVTPPMFKATPSDQSKIGNIMDVEKKLTLSKETLGNVKEAKLQAEYAAVLATAAVDHSQAIWDQLDKQKDSGILAEAEAKLAAAAVAIAAAASVAKAAAAAAKVASDAALQAKLMAEEAMTINGEGSSGIHSNSVNSLSDITPASILKGHGGMDSSGSIILAAREASRKRVEAASADSKQAENLDAIVKAAELVAQAVTQAGKVVAMGNPLSLSELVRTGPEGYWRVPPPQVANNTESVEHGSESSAKRVDCVITDQNEKRTIVSTEDQIRFVDESSTQGETVLRGQNGSKVSDPAKSFLLFNESNIEPKSTSVAVPHEQETAALPLEWNNVKEGSLVEVFKDTDNSKGAWFLASVSSLKDGEAYVCYTELSSASGQLKEWVPLKGEGGKAPRIRIPHPMTTVQYEGTKKRRRAEMVNYNWSVGDYVDAYMQDCWWEGTVTEKSKLDDTTLTVNFLAQGETSIVKAWQLRPSIFWNDGQWTEWSDINKNKPGSYEGDTPMKKRPKIGSSPEAEAKEKEKIPTDVGMVKSVVHEETKGSLDLGANEKTFNLGINSKPEASSRTARSGLQKEGPRVVFGVPKPGKKRKFMDVSKHYVADKNVKGSKVNLPTSQRTASHGWNNTKFDFPREKQPVDTKPRVFKTGKAESGPSRTVPQKVNKLTSLVSTIADRKAKPSLPVLSESVAAAAEKTERSSKGTLAPSGGKLAKIQEDKVYNGRAGSSVTDGVEPRRSNRTIQPTSRLLEGIQSSLSISKIPSLSHDRAPKAPNKNASSSRSKRE